MESVTRDNGDATFLRTLSSAYACKGNLDVIKLFDSDLSLFATPAPMGGTSRFSSSADMTSPTDAEFTFLQQGIDTLLYAGGLATDVEPTTSARGAKFSARDADEINMQLIYMLMVQIGRYFKYYGNTNAAGVKGLGTGTSQCFLNYDGTINFTSPAVTMAAYITSLNGVTGTLCNTTTEGHPDLGNPASFQMARMCQGVVLVNTFFNIFPTLLGSIAGTDFPWVSSLNSSITTGKNALDAALPGANAVVTNIMNQTNCVSLNTADTKFIQAYFAVIMENLLI